MRHPQLRLTIVPGILDEKGQLALKGNEAASPGIDPATCRSFSDVSAERSDEDIDHTLADKDRSVQLSADSCI